MSEEVNINLLLDRLYTTGKVDKKHIWALEHYITKLKQENERLKQQVNILTGKAIIEKDKKTKEIKIKALKQKDYKSRIDKAIEYTKQFVNGKTSRIDEWKNVELVLETILNILQGKEN